MKPFSISDYCCAVDAGPEQFMRPSIMVGRCIDAATYHANYIGIGYDDLMPLGLSWVLRSITLEMNRFPRVDESFVTETWVESFNRAFSKRNFRFTTLAGEVLGNATSVWVAIDINRRTLGDLSQFNSRRFLMPKLVSEVTPCKHQRALMPDAESRPYDFKYSDIDCNRHVTTTRYVELLLNSWDLEFHYAHTLRRLDVIFVKECKFGEDAQIRIERTADGGEAEIAVDGEQRVYFKAEFANR